MGSDETGTNFEYQFSSDGNELALPIAFEDGITSSWELLVEPVPYTRISANDAPQATGMGDLEATLTHRFLDETAGRPALSLAGADLTPRTQFFSEVLATSSASPTGVEIGAAAEVAGGEISGTIGLRRLFVSTFAGSLGVTYDNSGAVQVRPGFTLRLH